MALQNINTIINALHQFQANHLELKRFKCSFFEQFDNFSTSGDSFPILYAIPNEVSFEENIDVQSFRVYCVDILQKDRSNEQYILNDSLLVLRDLTNWLRQGDNGLNILNIPRAIPVNNFLVDFTCGWYIDIDIECEAITTECAIPFSSNFVLTGTTCDIAYVTDFLTCETLIECQGYIDLGNEITNIYTILSGLTGQTTYQYWTSGSTGNFAIKANNDSLLDATGNYAVAEGYLTKANGQFSHSEGNRTTASGDSSHSEGFNTIASGIYSHAEGEGSSKFGPVSAIGEASHAEGISTNAGGWAFEADSVVNGLITINASYGNVVSTVAGATNNTAYLNDSDFDDNFGLVYDVVASASFDGTNTLVQLVTTSSIYDTNAGLYFFNVDFAAIGGTGKIAIGSANHAEGNGTKAIEIGSHAEGQTTNALGLYSHSEGDSTYAIGQSSHAEGQLTQAKGNNSHSEGNQTRAIGDYSHSEGRSTTSSGTSSHAEGQLTTTIGNYSHAGGRNSIASGTTSFVHGDTSIAIGSATIVLGNNITGTTADTTYVDHLNIKTVPTGTTVGNLGIDASGNVILGTTGTSITFSGTPNYYARFNTGSTIENGIIYDNGSAGVFVAPQGDNASLNIVSPSGYYYPALGFSNNGGTYLGGISAYANTLYIGGFGAPITPLTVSSAVGFPYLSANTLTYLDTNSILRNVTLGVGLDLSTGGTLSALASVTGFTYNNANQFTITNNTGGTLSVIANTFTGVTVTAQSNLYGNILTSFSGSTSRIVEAGATGALTATKDLIDSFLSAGTASTLLSTTTNWSPAKVYTGTTITGTYQGQQYYDSTYYFICVDDNDWIRIARA